MTEATPLPDSTSTSTTSTSTTSAPTGAELGQRAISGTIVQALGQVITQGLRLGSNLMMTRLLEPDAFGLMQIVLAVTMGLALVSDVGVWQAIVQSPRGDDRKFLDTGFTLHVVRGFGLFLIGACLAVPAWLFYDRSEFLWLLPVTSLQALILGAESSNVASNARHLQLKRIMMLEIAAQVVALAVSIPLALVWRSVWALVAATLVSACARVLLSHVWLEGTRNRLAWDKEALAEIMRFGRWVFVSTTLFFLCTRWDVFAVGRMFGMEKLGVYAGIALLITSVPGTIGERLSGSVLTPLISHAFREDPGAFNTSLNRALSALLPAASVLFVGAALTAPAFITIAYRPAFYEATWMTQLLVIVAWFVFVQNSSTYALLAMGDTRSIAITNAVRLAGTVAFSALAVAPFGLEGFILGLAAGAACGVVAAFVMLRRRQLQVERPALQSSVAVLVLLVAGAWLPAWAAPRMGIEAPWLCLVAVVVCLGPYAAVVLIRARRILRGGIV